MSLTSFGSHSLYPVVSVQFKPHINCTACSHNSQINQPSSNLIFTAKKEHIIIFFNSVCSGECVLNGDRSRVETGAKEERKNCLEKTSNITLSWHIYIPLNLLNVIFQLGHAALRRDPFHCIL